MCYPACIANQEGAIKEGTPAARDMSAYDFQRRKWQVTLRASKFEAPEIAVLCGQPQCIHRHDSCPTRVYRMASILCCGALGTS